LTPIPSTSISKELPVTDQEVLARRLLDQWSLQQAESLLEREAEILNAQQPVRYLGNTQTSTYRGPSDVIWAGTQPGGSPTPGAWIEDALVTPAQCMHFFDDFLVTGSGPAVSGAAYLGSMGQWSIYLGSTAALADGGIVGGGIQFVPGSIAVSSGTSTPTTAISSMVGAFQITANSSGASALQGKLAFEARVMLTSATDVKRGAFVGLCDQAIPQSNLPFLVVSGGSSNELTSTRNLIGFYAPSSGGPDWNFVFQLASTAAVFPTNLQSLVSTVTGSSIVAGTFYKLGFIYDPNAQSEIIGTSTTGQTTGTTAKAMLKVYVNGIQAAAFLTQAANILTASFPTGIMGPIAAFVNVSNSGTSNSATNLSGKMTLDWIRVAQALLA
jgi:hypothetical protein